MPNFNYLKPGDGIIVDTCAARDDYYSQVERITLTQIILTDGRKFSRNNGWEIQCKDSWQRCYLEKFSAKKFHRINKIKQIRKILAAAHRLQLNHLINLPQSRIAAMEEALL